MFPRIHGKRRLHPQEFDIALSRIRHMFWNYRLVNIDYNAASYVREILLLGSTFSLDGSYTTLDGILISRVIRERVKLIS